MKTNQHTADQIIKILEQAEKSEQTIAAVCREQGIAENTFYRWRKAYGGMSVTEAQRLKELEKENARLKRLLAERVLALDLFKELLSKKADNGRATPGGAVLRRWRCRCNGPVHWCTSIARPSATPHTGLTIPWC